MVRPVPIPRQCVVCIKPLSEIWDLEVLCPCTDHGDDTCVGGCLSQTTQALGISITVGAGIGLSSTHPSAIKSDWDLRFGKHLITPSKAGPEYLSCIFTSSLTAALPWLGSWGAQILSALSWVHGGSGLRLQIYVNNALNAQISAPCVLRISMGHRKHYVRGVRDRPPTCARQKVLTNIAHWLFRHATWNHTNYTDVAISPKF